MPQNPTFADIATLLDTLVNNDPHLDDGSPHGAFWHGVTEAEFVATPTDDWGLGGPVIVPGNPDTSPLVQALAGEAPFDGSAFQRMPDKTHAHNARYATDAELQMIRTYILNLPHTP